MKRSLSIKRELTLRDRLSRLTYIHACRLLGEDGERILRRGARHDVDIAQHVHLRGDLFRLKLPEAVVTITLSAAARSRLQYNCTSCRTACEHVGAAFGLILEEKTALGLAAPPVERAPVESLSEEELVRRAFEERQERARTERMRIQPVNRERLWTDYLVTNAMSGKTYRVALRGWELGDSYCSCPDFRINTLGTCKHILKVHRYAKAKYPASVLNRRYPPKRARRSPAVRQGDGAATARARGSRFRNCTDHPATRESSHRSCWRLGGAATETGSPGS